MDVNCKKDFECGCVYVCECECMHACLWEIEWMKASNDDACPVFSTSEFLETCEYSTPLTL